MSPPSPREHGRFDIAAYQLYPENTWSGTRPSSRFMLVSIVYNATAWASTTPTYNDKLHVSSSSRATRTRTRAPLGTGTCTSAGYRVRSAHGAGLVCAWYDGTGVQDQYAKATKRLDNVRSAEPLLAQVY